MRNAGASALAALTLALASSGCARPSGAAGDRPAGFRLVTGVMQVPEEDVLGRQTTGLQVAAIAIGTADDPFAVDVFPSEVFDGSRIENSRFTVPVDGERSFVLVLQVPSASTVGPGALVAILRFATGTGESTLVPPGLDDIDLATLTVSLGDTTATTTLIVGDAHNPMAQIDTDADGALDLSDPDDDSDDNPDATDPDVGGDGVDDAAQLLSALPDDDGDGVPDLLEG
jgi:hypothetical protein